MPEVEQAPYDIVVDDRRELREVGQAEDGHTIGVDALRTVEIIIPAEPDDWRRQKLIADVQQLVYAYLLETETEPEAQIVHMHQGAASPEVRVANWLDK